jgi:serine/threonine protein kinase
VSGAAAHSAPTTERGEMPYPALKPIDAEGDLSLGLGRGAVLADRYVVESELGRGGAGTVYLAYDRVGACRVAIKRFHAEPSAGRHAAEGLLHELRCGRVVNHPNVCRVFDVFEAEGRWFLTMEHARGGTLRSLVGETAGSRPLADRVADARAIVAGVAAIHSAGFLHRDIKPENVLRMEDGRLVVSDFGLARAKDKLTASSNAAGTPGCRHRPPWVPLPPESPVTRSPPGGAETVLRLRLPRLQLSARGFRRAFSDGAGLRFPSRPGRGCCALFERQRFHTSSLEVHREEG